MKRILKTLLAALLCLGLLPMSVFAAPTKLSHVDITIELPKDRDEFDPNYMPKITSFTSGSIDLLAAGAGFLNASWDRGSNGPSLFRGSGIYHVTFQLMFGTGYCAAYTLASTGEYVATPETFSATINGAAATVRRNTSSYYPALEIDLQIEGEPLVVEQKPVQVHNEAWEQLKKTRRAMYTPRTWAESEAYNRDNMPEKVVTVTDPEGRELYENRENMTVAVFDVSTADKMAADIANSDSLKEIWLSPEVDPYKFIHELTKNQRSVTGGYNYWEVSAESPMYLSKGTVFIPESRVAEFKQNIDANDSYGYIGGALTVKCYSGDDVTAAREAGAFGAKEICTAHEYNTQIKSADRVYHFADCHELDLYYYSCGYCGKCEYNPSHVDYDAALRSSGQLDTLLDSVKALQSHSRNAELPAEAVYIGVNDAGNHVWWQSCERCGVFSRYDINSYDHKASGNQMAFENYKSTWIGGLKLAEAMAISSEETYTGTFAMPSKSSATMSTWAESDVNLALNDNLLDTALLGSDYTLNITRLQFCSVAVKLAEELIGRELTYAASTFTDTDSPYALKAYSTGITAGTGNGTFSPNATLTRQEMATFIYRTLRYVEQNSEYKYTSYNSKLDNYTDRGAVQSWAEEAMAFMNALDLVKGTTDTTLSPDGICTIEQAVAVAERSVYAHLLGWYQVNRAKNASATSEVGTAKMGGYALRDGDYVWVTGRRYGAYNSFTDKNENLPSVFVPIINPFNGQAAEMKNGDLVPVRN